MVRLEYANGQRDQFVTDEKWKIAPGATAFANIYAGEDYDARLDQAASPIILDARTRTPRPRRETCRHQHRRTARANGSDFEACGNQPTQARRQRFRFWPKCHDDPQTPGQRTGRIKRSHDPGSEVLKKDGSVDRKSCTQGALRPAWWQYTLAGTGDESFVPKFFWHGCRYLQVELQPAQSGGELICLWSRPWNPAPVHNYSTNAVGQFSCSSDLFNKIFPLVRWAQQNNMGTLMSDCPHRERLGWLEEDHLNGPSLRYNFGMWAHCSPKSCAICPMLRTSDGLIPDFVPEFTRPGGAFRDSSEWGSSLIFVAWQNYEFYGDGRLLSQYYEPMKHYFDHLKNKTHDNILGGGLGDWFDIGPKPPWTPQLTPVDNTDTCFYYEDAETLSKIAKVLGKDDDASQFASQAKAIRTSFNQHFFKPDSGLYSTGSQASDAIPYAMNMVEPEHRAAVFNGIVNDLKNHGNSFTTGEVAYRYLLRALADTGRSDLVFQINNQSDKPGYGMQIKKGCTSLTERWDGGSEGWSSQDHFMSGEIMEWFYHHLAGIQMTKMFLPLRRLSSNPPSLATLPGSKPAMIRSGQDHQ